MSLHLPPIREPLVTATWDESTRTVKISALSLNWKQWFSDLMVQLDTGPAGTTAQRPAPAPFIGFQYFDTTVGKPIWALTLFSWVDAAGAPI